MKYISAIVVSLIYVSVFADTPPPGTVKIKDSSGNSLSSTSGSLNVNVTNSGGGTSTVNQGTQGSSSSPWYTSITNSSIPVTGTFFQSTQPVSGTLTCNAGTGTQSVNVTNSSIPVTGTFYQSTQPVSATSLPLPTGAATQTTLASILSALGSPFQSGGSIGNTSFGISGTLPAFASTPTVNLGTLNGAATNATLVTINTTLGSPFQAGGSIGNTSFAATQATASALNATVVGPSGTTLAKDSSLTTINTTLGSPMQNSGGSVSVSNFPTTQAVTSSGTAFANAPVVNNYSTTNVTTSAYVQLVASTSNATNTLEVFDSSGQALYLAVGASGSEVNQFIIFPGGNGKVGLAIPSGSRVSVKAISATASAGSLYLNFYK